MSAFAMVHVGVGQEGKASHATPDGREALRARAMETAAAAILIIDAAGRVVDANQSAALLCGVSQSALPGAMLAELLETEPAGCLATPSPFAARWAGEVVVREGSGVRAVRHAISRPFAHEDGEVYRCVSIGQRRDGDQVRRSLRAQTLETLGELASGMAHEINTPTQYIGDNLGFLLTSFEQLAVMAVANGAAQADAGGELAYLLEEIPAALAQSREGLAQVGALVEALQQVATFSPRECEMVDANRELEFALTIARNVWKYIAEVTRDLDSQLPLVSDASGTLRQIALRLVLDAVRTVQGGERAERGVRGVIAVRTWIEGDRVAFSVRAGSTQRWASESGLHLVREAIGRELEGTVDVDYECVEGTTVTVRLPSAGSEAV